MRLFKKKKPKSTIKHSCKKCGKHGICAVKTFHVNLERERDRADRSGGIFSLVVYDIPENTDDSKLSDQLVETILTRLRLTDYSGWISHSQIGVILVDTPAAGARIFNNYILTSLPDKSLIPIAHVYTYPPENSRDDEHQMWFGDLDSVQQDNAAKELFSKAPTPPQEINGHKYQVHIQDEGVEGSEEIINEALSVRPALWKRAIDFTAALTALTLLSPVMLLIAAAIKLSSSGPALYKQQRVGYKGKTFGCYKFRSMHLHADTGVHQDYLKHLMKSDNAMTKLDKARDPRIFPVGRFIRASSLDELPQFINVLKGEMSLIGPRPCIPYEYKHFLPWHRHRVEALPGLTGLWQVSGKNKTTFSEMMRFDRSYAQNNTFKQDASIILKTPAVVIGQFTDDLRAKKGQKKHASSSRS